jgi:hypothetical protein
MKALVDNKPFCYSCSFAENVSSRAGTLGCDGWVVRRRPDQPRTRYVATVSAGDPRNRCPLTRTEGMAMRFRSLRAEGGATASLVGLGGLPRQGRALRLKFRSKVRIGVVDEFDPAKNRYALDESPVNPPC